MKLNSKYFDSIRVASKRQAAEDAERKHPPCEWKGCGRPAPYRAPKGRGRDGEYFAFCIDHVREYNAAYNYFDGMSEAERARRVREEPGENRRVLKPLEKKSLAALHLPETASKDEIKARFKELVKRHHPDANGGDTRSADTLREIIQAYNYLKKAGLV